MFKIFCIYHDVCTRKYNFVYYACLILYCTFLPSIETLYLRIVMYNLRNIFGSRSESVGMCRCILCSAYVSS